MQIFLCSLRKPRSQNPRNGKPRKPRDDCMNIWELINKIHGKVRKMSWKKLKVLYFGFCPV